MKIFAYLKARSLAKRFVKLVVAEQAIQMAKGWFEHDDEFERLLKTSREDIGGKIREIMAQVRLEGPLVANNWRDLVKQRMHNTKGSALLAELKRMFGAEFCKSITFPKDSLKQPVDGMSIRFYNQVIDKIDLSA